MQSSRGVKNVSIFDFRRGSKVAARVGAIPHVKKRYLNRGGRESLSCAARDVWEYKVCVIVGEMGATWGSPQFPYPPTISLKGACFSKRRNLENFATDAAEKRSKKAKMGGGDRAKFLFSHFSSSSNASEFCGIQTASPDNPWNSRKKKEKNAGALYKRAENTLISSFPPPFSAGVFRRDCSILRGRGGCWMEGGGRSLNRLLFMEVFSLIRLGEACVFLCQKRRKKKRKH